MRTLVCNTYSSWYSWRRTYLFSRSQLIVLHAEAEMLFVVMNIAGIEFLVVSAHGPHRAHSSGHHLYLVGKISTTTTEVFNYNVALFCFWTPMHMLDHLTHGLADIVEDDFDICGDKNCFLFAVTSRSAFLLRFLPYIMATTGTWQGAGGILKTIHED